ncbi:hypothetical protein DNK77_08755 [Enterobacter cloacae complex sp.]|uniref:pyocin knob domain-containing protein n=1 Tax=Enterobacter cloacae complex sp. TaxID=2027919 RepID=UPI000D8FA233|nr:pyocin knob domain-containing protein [Enterobacter cloacae complex sp.]PYZ32327.1 hypothetical protein DNK77_08755 [Enterobacter cloacae complex sp.]
MDGTSGRMLRVGDWGIGTSSAPVVDDANNARAGGIYSAGGTTGSNWADAFYPALVMNRGSNYIAQIQVTNGGHLASRRATTSQGWTPWAVHWNDKNTTVDSNGFIKRASPIIKLFGDGSYETNDESDGCTMRRIQTGQYLIEGCQGLNSDAAWGGIDGGFEIPTDRNKQPLIWLDYEVNADGSVLVKTYHRTHPDAPAFARNELQGINDGDPVDIPGDQFVSVRVEMPADSLYNQGMRAVELTMTADQDE